MIAALFFLLSVTNASAKFDYSLSAAGSTLPVGAAATFDSGYNHLLWGNPDAGPLRYGFLRPAIKIRENGVVHKFEGYVEIYPVPIFGIFVGHTEDFRNVKIKPYDCVALTCKGSMRSNYIGANLVLGYEGFFFFNEVQLDSLSVSDKTRDFVDESSTLKGSMGRDSLLTSTHLLGKRLGSGWTAGALALFQSMRIDRSASDRLTAFASYRQKNLTYSGGAGLYHSNVFARSFTAFFRITWTIAPSFGFR